MPPRLTDRLTGDARIGALAAVLGTALLVSAMAPFQDDVGLLNEGLMLLLLTLAVSATWGLKTGLFAAVVTNLSLNYFFVPPLHTLNVGAPRNVLGLGVFLVVSVVGGSLLSRARGAAADAVRRQAETETLLRLSRSLIGRTEPADALGAFCENVVEVMGAQGAAVLSLADEEWRVLASSGDADASREMDANDRALAAQALVTGRSAARGHTGLRSGRTVRIVARGARGMAGATGSAFVPLKIGDRALGVLRVDGPMASAIFRDHAEEALEAFAREAALGVQGVELAQASAHADALREADSMKTMLLTSISHDLKTPLAGIKASVSSLRDRSVSWTDEDRESFLEAIDTQSDRLNQLISDILDLNRIESGAVKPAVVSVRALDLLQDAVERTSEVTAARRVTFDAASALMVRGDASLVVQALANLIDNAARHSTPGGSIGLSAASAGSRVEIVVADEGPGIAPRDLPRVFEPFYRGDSRRGNGHGLGLSIVKGFVELSGGRVRVESSASGTRFILSFPRANGKPTA